MPNRSHSWMDEITHHRVPLAPLETTVKADLCELDSIKAVIFDVYGTLVVSGSGDVGSADSRIEPGPAGDLIAEAMQSIGIVVDDRPLPTKEALRRIIDLDNEQRQGPQCPSPEVNIVAAWQQMLVQFGYEELASDIEQVVRLATAFEARANSTWPMPGAGELIQRLSDSGIKLGIVSNAQVFTPELVTDLRNSESLIDAGFEIDLCFFSNRFRQSKPASRMFDSLKSALARFDIAPSQSLYVGNDMLNDVYAANQMGMKTAWFAGDRRSCRPRHTDSRCCKLRPDLTLTNLLELLHCLLVEMDNKIIPLI